MNNLNKKEIATSISQSLFNEKFPQVNDDEKEAVNRAIWYIYNTQFGKDKILRKSAKPFKVPMTRIESYIIKTLGTEVFLKRNSAFNKLLYNKYQ